MSVELDAEVMERLVFKVETLGTCVVLSMDNADGLELHRLLTEHYGRIESGKIVKTSFLERIFGRASAHRV